MEWGNDGGSRTAERFRRLVQERLVPRLAPLGFEHRLPGSLVVAERPGVLWLLDLELAGWSTPKRVTFAVAWGVHVPGVEQAVGDAQPSPLRVDDCLLHGRVGERSGGLDPCWFGMRSLLGPLASITDTALVTRVVATIERDLVPELAELSSPEDVQRRIHRELVTGRGLPTNEELQTIRRIAALSLFLGDRENAARWLDHLEARSAAAMAPDLVAERLAPLRDLIAS